jgi:hypothetical protein
MPLPVIKIWLYLVDSTIQLSYMSPLSYLRITVINLSVYKIITSKYLSYMGREVELFHPHLVITFINRSADIKNPALTRSKTMYIWESLRRKKTRIPKGERPVNIWKYFVWNQRHFRRTHDFLFGTHDFFLGTHDFSFGTHDFLPTTHDFLPTTFYPRPMTFYPRPTTFYPRPTTVS